MYLESARSPFANHMISTSAETSAIVKTGSSKVVSRTASAVSSSGFTSVRTIQSASAANYQPARNNRAEVSSNIGISGNGQGTQDSFANGYKDQPHVNESSNHADHREDSLSETYSLIRERNTLLNRLEQVHMQYTSIWRHPLLWRFDNRMSGSCVHFI